MHRNLVALVAALVIASRPAHAVDSQEWVLSSVDNFLAGEFEGVILEHPGTLRVGLDEHAFPIDASQVWSVAQDSQGRLYAGTGNEGHVYVIGPDGEALHTVETDGSQVYALVVTEDDVVYAASSPDGAIFRLADDGTAEEWYRPEATYIWSLLPARDGSLYATTGDPATVIRITGQDKGAIVYESADTHLMTLAEPAAGTLLAGTGETGVVVEFSLAGDGASRVVYDAPLEEIRSILPLPDGGFYFVAVQSQPGAVAPAASLKLGGLTSQGNGTKKDANDKKKAQASSGARGAAASVIYRVDVDGRVEPLWTGKNQRVYGAALLGEDVVFGTDQKGTVFRLSPDGVPAVIYRGRHGKVVTTTTDRKGHVLLGTAEAASIVRLGPKAPDTAMYTSAVQDAETLAFYGRVRWSLDGAGRGPTFRVRTGNTREPDDRWTEWSAPNRERVGGTAGEPGRFLQFRLEWAGKDRAVGVTHVSVPFAQRNLPPRVVNISIEAKGRLPSASVNVGAESDGTALQALLKRYNSANGKKKTEEADEGHATAIKVTWKALDPNNDTLEFMVQFRGVEETLWKELEAELDKPEYEWQTQLVPDGWYDLRVVADDRPSNAAGQAAEASLVSEPVLVDNTGPVVGAFRTARGPGKGVAVLTASAEDGLLPLRRGRYALDGQPWVWFAPDDGIFDGRKESFRLEFTGLEPGEHTVAVQVLDTAQNIGTGKNVFSVE